MRHVFLLIGTCLWVTVAAGAAGAHVLCRQSAGVDPAHAEALCKALRGTDAPDGLQLRVLATTPVSVTAMVVRPDGRARRPMRLNVIDRDLTDADFAGFARDLLRSGLAD